ncbi:MAG: RsmB/NOP family class I SAM-dependent RNA methyltransferase [Desulfovibrionaceae bacterium]
MIVHRSFRLVCAPEHIPQVESLLQAQGFVFEAEPFSPFCRRLCHEPMALGASLAAFFGYIYIQDRSSMLPPLALNPHAGARVLDMCASPGSKMGFLAQLVGTDGFVLGNEPARPRLLTLRSNMQGLHLLHAATCSYGGETLPLRPESWDFIQLDPPCSGWGTVDKNPRVREVWKGEKTVPLISLQKKLLAKAAQLLRVGGRLVYSTCTTNTEENEAQVRYAVNELGLQVLPLRPFDGFAWEEPQAGGAGTLRVDGARSQAQGFYIACFTKSASNVTAAQDAAPLFTLAPHQCLEREGINADCLEWGHLPPGHLAVFGDTVRFIPQGALECLPAALVWQGAKVGKWAGGKVHFSSLLRTLLPPEPPDNALQIDDAASIVRLIGGQSLHTNLHGVGTGLYWQGLPLGRVKLKQGRALWTAC